MEETKKTQKPILTLCRDNYCLTLKSDEKTETGDAEDALTSITHSNVCEFVSLQIVMLNSLSDLYGYVDKGQLTCELGGNLDYCHSQWIHRRTVSYHDIGLTPVIFWTHWKQYKCVMFFVVRPLRTLL